MNFIKKIFGISASTDYNELMKRGATIVDVRTPAEYASGHIIGSVNIPLNDLQRQLKRLPDKQKPIITCCASGMRSGSAKNILRSKGYNDVTNGGSWFVLNNKLQKK